MKRKPIKKSMKITIAGFILVLAAVIFSAGYVNANSRIKPPEEIYFDGKSGTETEKNLFFKVEDFYFLGDKEIRNMPELPDSTIYPMEMKVICLNIFLKNTGTTELAVDLTKYVLESEGWYNSIDPDFSYILNPEDARLVFTLTPGETREMILPFFMLESHFYAKEWKQIEDREFWLTFNLYPQKKMVTF